MKLKDMGCASSTQPCGQPTVRGWTLQSLLCRRCSQWAPHTLAGFNAQSYSLKRPWQLSWNITHPWQQPSEKQPEPRPNIGLVFTKPESTARDSRMPTQQIRGCTHSNFNNVSTPFSESAAVKTGLVGPLPLIKIADLVGFDDATRPGPSQRTEQQLIEYFGQNFSCCKIFELSPVQIFSQCLPDVCNCFRGRGRGFLCMRDLSTDPCRHGYRAWWPSHFHWHRAKQAGLRSFKVLLRKPAGRLGVVSPCERVRIRRGCGGGWWLT